MYWGEGTVSLATSSDLIHWDPVLDANGNIEGLLKTRPGHFDSALVEGGPPAVLLHRASSSCTTARTRAGRGDPNVSPGAYSDGQALFDPKDPTRLEARLDHPFLQPQAAFESTGQYAAGTVFIEGLTYSITIGTCTMGRRIYMWRRQPRKDPLKRLDNNWFVCYNRLNTSF